MPLYRESVALYQSLGEDFPTIPVYRFFLSKSRHAFGDVLRDSGHLSESQDHLDAAVELQRTYVRLCPENTFGRSLLADRLDSLGKTLDQLGEHEQATAVKLEAEEIRCDVRQNLKKRRRPAKPPLPSENGKDATSDA